MEVTAVVLHDGALAHYDVDIDTSGVCYAKLSAYKGSPDHTPPQYLTLKKEGRHWVGDSRDRELSDELGYAIEIKAKPLIDERRRGDTHPAG